MESLVLDKGYSTIHTIRGVLGPAFCKNILPFLNGRISIDTDLKITKDFTKIADKNMQRYAKICGLWVSWKSDKNGWKAHKYRSFERWYESYSFATARSYFSGRM